MSLKMCIRYNFDMSITDQGRTCGKKKNSKCPIGDSTEYVGDSESIKKRICLEIDNIYMKLEDMYWEGE